MGTTGWLRLTGVLMAATLGACAATASESHAPPDWVVEVEDRLLREISGAGDAWTVVPLLEALPGVSVRNQGYGGVQTDIGVRGGAFNASGLLVGGLALRNPQTEHFQCDLSVPDGLFAAPSVLTGLERFAVSQGHPSGAVAFDFSPIETGGLVSAGAGQGGQFLARLRQGVRWSEEGTDSGAAGFASWDAADRTDGQADNDLRRWSLGGQGQYRTEAGQFDLLAVGTMRAFGARGFYGTPVARPSEERVEDLLAVGSYAGGDRSEDRAERVTVALRRTEDAYWYNGRQAGNPNRHVSDVYALHGDAVRPLGGGFRLAVRGDAAWERVTSASLGDHERGQLAAAVLPGWRYGNWDFTAGAAAEAFSDDRPAWLPAAGAAYRLSDIHRLYASISEAVRQPSYTEYNYNNPTSLGNRGLDRQHTRTAEAGWRGSWSGVEGGLALFHEQGRNVVDWVRLRASDAFYRAVNLESVTGYGLTADAVTALAEDLDVMVSGMLLHKSSDEPFYASRYALDYEQQHLRVDLRWRPARAWDVRLWQRVGRMEQNPLRNGGRTRADAGGEVRWQVPRAAGLTLVAGVANLWNGAFEVYPGQPEAGRRFYTVAEFRW